MQNHNHSKKYVLKDPFEGLIDHDIAKITNRVGVYKTITKLFMHIIFVNPIT
jgi:hypothetical protein